MSTHYYNFGGFELGNALDLGSISGTAEIQSTTKRTGAYAFRAYPSGGNSGNCRLPDFTPTGLNQTGTATVASYGCVYIKWAGKPASNSEEIIVLVGTPNISIRLNSSAQLSLYNGNSLLDSDTTVLDNNWHLIEWAIDSVGDTQQVKLDGVVILTAAEALSSQNIGLALGKLTNWNGEGIDVYYDDWAFSIEEAPTPGECKIGVAIGAGAASGWPDGTGTTFEEVNDLPHTTDTDYIAANATRDNADHTFDMASASTIGVVGEILAVKTSTVSRTESTSGSSNIAHRRLFNGEAFELTGIEDTTTYRLRSHIDEIDPSTGGGAITVADFDSIEVGMAANTIAQIQRCTAVYIQVWSRGATSVTIDVATNAVISIEASKDVATNAVIGLIALKDVSTNASVVLQGAKDVATNAAIATTNQAEVTTNAAINILAQIDVNTAAVISLLAQQNVSTDASIITQAIIDLDVATDAAITTINQVDILTDAAISALALIDALTDAVISLLAQVEVSTDAHIVLIGGVEVATDAAISLVTQADIDITTDAAIATINIVEITTDAIISILAQIEVVTDAAISIPTIVNADVATEAAITAQVQLDIETAASIIVEVAAQVDVFTDAVITVVAQCDVSSDAAISALVDIEVSTDAVITITASQEIATDAVISTTAIVEISSDAAIAIQAETDVTTEAATTVITSINVLTDACISIQIELDVLTNASIALLAEREPRTIYLKGGFKLSIGRGSLGHGIQLQGSQGNG